MYATSNFEYLNPRLLAPEEDRQRTVRCDSRNTCLIAGVYRQSTPLSGDSGGRKVPWDYNQVGAPFLPPTLILMYQP